MLQLLIVINGHPVTHTPIPINNYSESENEGEKNQGRNEERLPRTRIKDDKTPKLNFYNNRYYSSGLPFKTAVGNYQSQQKELVGQMRPYPPRMNLTPISSTQQIGEQNKGETLPVLLPVQKTAQTSSSSNTSTVKNAGGAGGNLPTSNTGSTSSTSTATTTGRLGSKPTPNNSMNPLSSNGAANKNAKPECLKPEEREKRRHNYQAQASLSQAYKVSSNFVR